MAGRSGIRNELRNEISFARGEQHDFQLAMLRFNEIGTVDVNLASRGIGVLDDELAAAADLEAIVEDGSGIEPIVAKTGAGIVNLEKLNRRTGAVFDGGIDVIGVAAGDEYASDRR